MNVITEDNNEKGTVQYWLEVHRIGSLLFQNIKNGDSSLKPLITSIIETPLLSDIECLSGNEVNEDIVCPFTAWLLENLFKASVCHSVASHLKTFYTVAQSRLLTSTYERDLFAFESIIKRYVEFLEKSVKVRRFPSEFTFLLSKNVFFPNHNKTLKSVVFQVNNKKELFEVINILLEVLKSVFNLISYSCLDVHPSLWKVLIVLLKCNYKSIGYMVLPMMNEMLNSCELQLDENIVKFIMKTLIVMLEDSSLGENSIYQHYICEVWNSVKCIYPIKSIFNEDLIKGIIKLNILQNKKFAILKNFLINELSSLLSEIFLIENIFIFLEQIPEISLNDKLLLLLDFVLYEFEVFIRNENLLEGKMFCEENQINQKVLVAVNVSKTWSKILYSQVWLLEDKDPANSKFRLENIIHLVKFCWKVLHHLDKKLKISKFCVTIHFFQNNFMHIIDKILIDINLASIQQEQVLQLGLEALSCLLNLPEAKDLDGENFMKCIEFLITPLSSDKFHIPGFNDLSLNSSIPALFLRCLQTLPLGVSVEHCIAVFTRWSSCGELNKYLTIQAVKSVPFLFFSRKTSPSRLISEILLPVVIQENKDFLGCAIDSTVDLVCALAGTGYAIRNQNFELKIQCCECGSDCVSHKSEGDLPLVEAHLYKLICQIPLQDTYIKRKFLRKFPRIIRHMPHLANQNIMLKILPFLSDNDVEVRQLLSKCIGTILNQNRKKFNDCVKNDKSETYCSKQIEKDEIFLKEMSTILELIFHKLEEFIHLSLKSKEHSSLQYTLMETLIQVASFSHPDVLCKSTKLFLLFLGHPNISLPAIFLEVTATHKTTPLLLYYSFRPEISHFLGNLIAIYRIQYKQSLRSILSEVITIFKGLSGSRLITGSESYIIPVLLSWVLRYPNYENLLEEWSSYTGQALPVILSRCFQNIYTYILLNESEEYFEKCMFYVEKLTDLKLADLMLHSQKLIINQLLFNYHRFQEKVLYGLKKAMSLNPNQGKEEVADNLEQRFVGYLLFIVSKFVKDLSPDSEKIQAIHSLTAVIQLMGKKYVTPVARKVLATLQTALKFNRREYNKIQLNSWETFVTHVEPNELGPLLATIIVSLVPFLEFLPTDVSRIFTYLIVKNENAVKDFLSVLIFLPEHPLLSEVKLKLNQYIQESQNIKDQLNKVTSLVLHETVGVRVEGLKALQKSLKRFSVEIQNLIIGSDEPDACVKILLEGLITCCSDSDQNISNLAASCLGQLGAIDPGLFPRKPKPKNSMPLSVHDPEFAFLALSEISRGFQNARNSVDMDAFAIGIQELLKIYQIGPSSENDIWDRFSVQIQNLITPMLSSRYTVQASKRETLPDILFGSKAANTHISWASLWAGRLIGYCRDDRAVVLFKVCEPSLKRDPKVLLFFLQYILLQAILRDSSVHDSVIKEIEAVINYNPQNIEHDDFRIKSRPIRLVDYCGYPNMRSTITKPEAQNCAMTVFLLIDFLQSWLRIYSSVNCSSNGEHLQKRDYVIVKDFLNKIDYLKVSVTNFEIREYPRAIMYLEDVISASGNLSEHLPLLSKAYALYGDLDSVAGSSTFQKTALEIEDLLLSHQVSGQLEEVRIIYEKLGKGGLLTPAHAQEMVQCYLNLGEPFTALNHIKSFTKEKPDLMSILSEGMAESLIKLGEYSQLDKYLKKNNSSQADWFVQIGELLLSIRNNEKENVLSKLSKIRLKIAGSIKQAGLQLSNYQQGYFNLVKLQMLNEIERIFEIIHSSDSQRAPSPLVLELVQEWNLKSSIVQSDQSSLEPLLSMRRVLLNLLKEKLPVENENFLNIEIAKFWVKSAEIARKAGCFHQAYNFILNAEHFNIPLTFIEKAQLYWDKNDQDLCLFTLDRGIKEFFPNSSEMKNWPAGERFEERKMCADAKLLYAIYSEETSNCDHNTNMTNYQSAFEVCRQLEKSEAFLAQCLDRVVMHLDNNEQEERKICELKVLMVYHFGKSLMYGCEYIYQTVPRMLSIWLDLGEKVDTEDKSNALGKINKIIQGFVDSLPAFIFMTALPQLLSRLGHPNRKVFMILKDILVLLLKAFPQQCLWAVQAVAKSSVSGRVQRYNEFIQDPSLRSSGLFKLISDFTNLCDKLNKLTNRNLPKETAFRGLKVSSIVRELPQLLASEKFSAIIVPITRFCAISLPRNITSSSHDPFPKEAVYITGIEDDVTVLQSLQRPRKISFRGSDGKLYDILCKPKDDLRRDGRLMEFNNIVNMYLHRDPESRLRGLHIRTYVVTPLGEGGGLLEWVPNLTGLRQILIKLYKQFGKYTNTREIKRYECQVRDSLEKKRSIFVEKLLVLHPPLFPEWFRLTFPDPSGWYIARESYVRTTAVMSMVGYILGLGDRHGENILFDSESGDTVHVDFNCLFNKGEKFDWKERVPFRLTHNMVSAMGPFGVEGTFRKSCEISLRVLRSQSKTLMSVLTPFAYDPFGSWGKNKEIVQNERDQKIGEAFIELNDIKQRLNGSLRVKQKQSTVYLSVEGQARSLIIEATDIDNLCQMYFGWGAYL